MKKLIYIALILFPFVVNAQIVTEKSVKISGNEAKKLDKAPKKVFFKEFNIGYQVIAQNSTVSISGSNRDKVSITAGLDSKLVGEDFVAITNKAYEKVANV